jgi:hypothetical protein
MSVFCVVWLCTQERWKQEVAIILDAAARYRRATVGSSHNDAHSDNSALHMIGGGGRFAHTPALWKACSSNRPVRAMAVRKCSKCCQCFRRIRGLARFVLGIMHPYFQWAHQGRREEFLSCLDGLTLL